MRAAALFFSLIAATFSLIAAGPALADPLTVDFSTMPAGKPPPGFSTALTGKGSPGRWIIAEDAAAPDKMRVLAQTSIDPTENRFPLCIHDAFAARDVDVETRFRPVSGKVDRAAGIVIRLRAPDNYYVVRANALEDNVRLYRVVNGERRQFAGASAKVPSAQWQTLRIRAAGDRFEVFLDGRSLFRAIDGTFLEPGKVGLWTKADSVTHFATLNATPLP
jgi:hypothetical protein